MHHWLRTTTMTMVDFLETDHGKLLAGAKRYLMAADVLRRSPEYAVSRMLFTPTLHLAAHGIEVLLKGNLVGSSLTLDAVRKAHGHDILGLWKHDGNRLLRDEAHAQARLAWNLAKNDPAWPDTFSGDPATQLEEYLEALGELHGSDTDYALRYVAPSTMMGPRPHLLVETFLKVSDLCLKQPRCFIIS